MLQRQANRVRHETFVGVQRVQAGPKLTVTQYAPIEEGTTPNLSKPAAEEHSVPTSRGVGWWGRGCSLAGISSLPAVTSVYPPAALCKVRARPTQESVMLWSVPMSSSLSSMKTPSRDQNCQQHLACDLPFKILKLWFHSFGASKPSVSTLGVRTTAMLSEVLSTSILCTF